MEPDQVSTQPFITGIYEPERAESLRKAAGFTEGVEVEVFDPSIPNEANEFAIAAAQEEVTSYSSGVERHNNSRSVPRTPDQIKRDVVDFALRGGKVLVVIQCGHNDLGDFWKRADQLSA